MFDVKSYFLQFNVRSIVYKHQKNTNKYKLQRGIPQGNTVSSCVEWDVLSPCWCTERNRPLYTRLHYIQGSLVCENSRSYTVVKRDGTLDRYKFYVGRVSRSRFVSFTIPSLNVGWFMSIHYIRSLFRINSR